MQTSLINMSPTEITLRLVGLGVLMLKLSSSWDKPKLDESNASCYAPEILRLLLIVWRINFTSRLPKRRRITVLNTYSLLLFVIAKMRGKFLSKLSADYFQTLKFSGFILSWVGLRLFYDEGDTLIDYHSENGFFFLSFFVLATCIFGEAVYLMKAIHNLENFLEVTALAPCLGMCTLGFVKMYTTWSARWTIQEYLLEIGEIWPKNIDGKRNELKIASTKKLKVIIQIYFWLFFILIWIYNLYPLLELAVYVMLGGDAADIPRKQPYYVWYPFSDVEPFWQYAVIYLSQIWYGWVAIFGCVAADCLLFVVTSHICLLFELLQCDIVDLVPNYHGESMHSNMLKIIRKHHQLLRITAGLEEVNNVMILINFFCGSFIICLVGFQATAIATNELIKFLFFLAASLVQVFIMCFYGDLLQETSAGLAWAAYNCDWYRMNLSDRKTILFIIIRAQKPSFITAYKYTAVSLRSFTKILSTSWSYFTLLRTIYDPSKSIKKHS